MKVTDELNVPGTAAPGTAPNPGIGRMLMRRGPNEWRCHWVMNNVVLATMDIMVVDPGAAGVIGADMANVMGQIRSELSGLVRAPAGALDGLPAMPPGLRQQGRG